MSDEEKAELRWQVVRGNFETLGYIAIGAFLLSLLAGCAPAPEWSGKPTDLAPPGPPELRCVGREPPEMIGAGVEVDCETGSSWCSWRDVAVWRCPVVLADTEFNK